jgi:hypothetical protein
MTFFGISRVANRLELDWEIPAVHFIPKSSVRQKILFFPRTSLREKSRSSDWLRAGRPRGQHSNSGRFKNVHFSLSFWLVLGPTQPPIQSVRWLFRRSKATGDVKLTAHLQIGMSLYCLDHENTSGEQGFDSRQSDIFLDSSISPTIPVSHTLS